MNHDSAAALLGKDSLEMIAMRIRKIKEMRPEVSNYLNIGILET
jgi:hypothetical protein